MGKKTKTIASAGFTIVELLIVIVVIGILAALVLNTFSKAQEKAKAAAISDGLKKTERSLMAFALSEGVSQWWLDDDLAGENNPRLSVLIQNTSFGQFMAEEPNISGAVSAWRYDNEGNLYDGCSNSKSGVNIILSDVTNNNIAQLVDNTIDDGNLNCGKLRRIDADLRYNISLDSNVE